MYILKDNPKDFVVDELIDYSLLDDGIFVVYKLKKSNCNTMDAIHAIAKEFRISPKLIGYAGLKDKIAVTTQFISFPRECKDKIGLEYSFDTFSLTHVGFRNERIYPGCLSGNAFTILVKDYDSAPKKLQRMINYFGEQRFSQRNVEVGRLLLQKKWNEVVAILREITDFVPSDLDGFEAVQKFPKRLLRIYLHAYQSFIWNETVRELVRRGEFFETVQLPGFDFETDGTVGEIVSSLLEKDGLVVRDFIIRQLNGLGLEAQKRDVYVPVHDCTIEEQTIANVKQCTVRFSLQKGSYATECIKQMFE